MISGISHLKLECRVTETTKCRIFVMVIQRWDTCKWLVCDVDLARVLN